MINTAYLTKLAYQELEETSERRAEAICELRERIFSLPSSERLHDVSDCNLIRFIRARKYDLDKALKTTISLRKFENSRAAICDPVFTFEEMCHFEDFFQILPRPDKSGHLVVVFQLIKVLRLFTPEFLQQYPDAFMRSNLFFLQQISLNHFAQICGVVVLIDFDEFTLWDSLKFSTIVTVENTLSVLHYVQSCIGLRLAGVHLFHAPAYVTWLWGVVKLFLNERMAKRFHFSSDYEDILESLGAEVLPVKYGGAYQDTEYSWLRTQFDAPGTLLKPLPFH